MRHARARLRRLVLATALVALFGGAIPAAAAAATVTISFGPGNGSSEHGPPPLGASLSFIAAPGETNDVSVSGVTHGYRIHDAGALVSGDPAYCSNTDPHTVVCAVSATATTESGFEHASFSLGDGNDVFRGIDTSGYTGQGETDFFVDGGPGNDQLTAGAARRVTLTGSSGDDTVTGGPGDTILPGPGQDVLNGLGGTLDFSSVSTPVTVDLRRGVARTRGENDKVANFQKVLGGAGNDTLIAGASPVSLDGGPGHNTLIGGAGKTVMAGSDAGNRIICGTGRNVVVAVTARDLVGVRCRRIEAADSLGEAFVSQLPLRSPLAAAAVLDEYQCIGPPCTLTLRISVAAGKPHHRNAPGGRLLGERRVLLRRDGSKVRNVGVALSPVGAALLQRDGRLRVTVSFSTHDLSGGVFSDGSYSTILRRP